MGGLPFLRVIRVSGVSEELFDQDKVCDCQEVYTLEEGKRKETRKQMYK